MFGCSVLTNVPTCIVLSPRSGLPACMHLHHLASDDSMFKGCVLEISIPKDYKFGKWNPLPCTQSFGSTGWPSAQEMERSLIFKMLPAWALWPFFCSSSSSRSEPWWSDDECLHVAKTFIVIEVKSFIHKWNVGSHLLLSRMCVQVQNAGCLLPTGSSPFLSPAKGNCIWCVVGEIPELRPSKAKNKHIASRENLFLKECEILGMMGNNYSIKEIVFYSLKS